MAMNAIDATIDYLVPTSRINRRFWAPGAEHNTGVYQPYPVKIGNGRHAGEPFLLDIQGFALRRHVSAVHDFTDAEEINTVYRQEIIDLAMEWTGADIVVPMAPQIRCSGQTGISVQPPAGEAHVDFNTRSAAKVARRVLDMAGLGEGQNYNRFIAFSIWRTFSPAPQDWPLALCDYRSVGDEEGVPNVKIDVDVIPEGDALFAPIPGEEEMIAASIFRHNPAHRWWYFPDMTRDEAIFIKFHDSDRNRAWRAPHTAFRDTSRLGVVTRESIEYRAIAYFME